MCIISLRSYKYQFLKILGKIQEKFTQDSRDQKIEAVINRILFGIPSPRFEFNDIVVNGQEIPEQQKSKVVKLAISEDHKENVYFKNQNLFDLHNNQYENVWTLINTLNSENILTLYRRLIFNTCNILIGNDQDKLNKCILGVLELFYPLTTEMTIVPNLTCSMLEYVSMCGQSLIGVYQKKTQNDNNNNPKVKSEENELYNILQDNSCQINIENNYSIQKPKQLVGFNPKGKLAEG